MGLLFLTFTGITLPVAALRRLADVQFAYGLLSTPGAALGNRLIIK
jgi:hypothetical protein